MPASRPSPASPGVQISQFDRSKSSAKQPVIWSFAAGEKEAFTPKFGPAPFNLSSPATTFFSYFLSILLLKDHYQQGHNTESRTKAIVCISAGQP